MNLFIDAVSTSGSLILFDEERHIIAREEIALKMNENKKLLVALDNFLKKEGVTYLDLKNIFCVNGPGSFTGIRTITLVVNTIAFLYPHIFLTDISFFDLFDEYPILKSSSKRDVFLKKSAQSEVEIFSNDEAQQYLSRNNISHFFGDVDKNIFPLFTLDMQPNYDIIIKNTKEKEKQEISPLYIKKPNIS